MIKIEKIAKDIYCQCTSCQCGNKDTNIYKIDIGKNERQTVSFRLCGKCSYHFCENLNLEIKK